MLQVPQAAPFFTGLLYQLTHPPSATTRKFPGRMPAKVLSESPGSQMGSVSGGLRPGRFLSLPPSIYLYGLCHYDHKLRDDVSHNGPGRGP